MASTMVVKDQVESGMLATQRSTLLLVRTPTAQAMAMAAMSHPK